MHLINHIFFFGGGEGGQGGLGFWGFFFVPNVFPNLFSLILSHMLCPILFSWNLYM